MNQLKKNDAKIDPEFVKDSEGAELARMSIGTFRKLAEEFGAVYRYGKVRVTNWDEFKADLKRYRG